MKINTNDRIWCVTEPTPISEMADICFETSVAGLLVQSIGGLNADEHKPMIFFGTDAKEAAELEAIRRLKARKLDGRN